MFWLNYQFADKSPVSGENDFQLENKIFFCVFVEKLFSHSDVWNYSKVQWREKAQIWKTEGAADNHFSFFEISQNVCCMEHSLREISKISQPDYFPWLNPVDEFAAWKKKKHISPLVIENESIVSLCSE